MSDGNFNRALLPSTPYASGLKTGRAQARQAALRAFDEWLATTLPSISDEQRDTYAESFRRILNRH